MERHARWIADAGVGAIDVSWWGPDSNVNDVIPTLMDVMAAHDIHVTFYVEPYTQNHAENYARDLLYLIRNYGDRRHWDCFLLHEYEDGTTGPVFKSFRTILLPTGTDCHGVTTPVADYAADDVWRRQTDAIREHAARDFDRLTLLADSSQVQRTQAGRVRRHRAVRQLRVAGHLADARRELHRARPRVLVPGQPGLRQHRLSADRSEHVLHAAGVRAGRRRLRLDARRRSRRGRTGESAADHRFVQHDGQPADLAVAGQRAARVLPRLHQLVQRVARRSSVRAGEGPRASSPTPSARSGSTTATRAAIVSRRCGDLIRDLVDR